MAAPLQPGTDALRRLLPEPPPGGWESDEPQMETYAHLMQMLALIATLKWLWRDRTDRFVAGNLSVYFSPTQKRSEDFRGPDLFVVFDVDATKPRKSWTVWEEGGRYPDLILEILSETTAHVDRGEKLQVYQDTFRTPEYFLFDPESGALQGFRLQARKYRPIRPNEHGRLESELLGLSLGAVERELRLFFPDGTLVPKPEESALEARRRAEEQQRRAEEQQRRAELAEAELAALRARRDDFRE